MTDLAVQNSKKTQLLLNVMLNNDSLMSSFYLGLKDEYIDKKQESSCIKVIILTWSHRVQHTFELHVVCDAVWTLGWEESTQSVQSVRAVQCRQSRLQCTL